MDNKLLYAIGIVIILTCTLIIFPTVVNANSLNIFCLKKQQIVVTLKNEANIDVSKNKILEIPQIKITKIQYRDKEWSKMVNKMDLPNMENPFKNEPLYSLEP